MSYMATLAQQNYYYFMLQIVNAILYVVCHETNKQLKLKTYCTFPEGICGFCPAMFYSVFP